MGQQGLGQRGLGQHDDDIVFSHAAGSGDASSGKHAYSTAQAYVRANAVKSELEKQLGCMEDEQKAKMIAFVVRSYPDAVRIAATKANMFQEAQQAVVNEVERTWSRDLGSAIRSVCQLSEKAYQRLIQLLGQKAIWVNDKLKYVARVLSCGIKFPQLCANASVRQVRIARDLLASYLKITTSHLSNLLDGQSTDINKCNKKHKKASQTACRRPVKDIVADRIQFFMKTQRIDLSRPVQV